VAWAFGEHFVEEENTADLARSEMEPPMRPASEKEW
jgi:hypothetical protein